MRANNKVALRFEDCHIGMKINANGDKQVLVIVDLHPELQMITYAFRDHKGRTHEHTMEPHLYTEA